MKRSFLIPWLFLAGVVGCGDSEHNLPPMAPVRGVVTLDGHPVDAGQVVLLPEVENKAGLSAGTIGSDGAFEIHTAGKEGAPLGKYRVAVTPSMVPSPNQKGMPRAAFAPKYSDQKNTPLRIQVVDSPKPGVYDLKLTKR